MITERYFDRRSRTPEVSAPMGLFTMLIVFFFRSWQGLPTFIAPICFCLVLVVRAAFDAASDGRNYVDLAALHRRLVSRARPSLVFH